MAGSDENNPGLGRPAYFQGGLRMEGGKFVPEIRHNRRALSNINRNLVGAPTYPCTANKRSLPEKRTTCDKNPLIPLHRPITRKFAAEMANKQQPPCLEEAKAIPSFNSTASEDCIIVDVDDYKGTNDLPIPMFVKHTEAILDENDQMEEVEMEDIAVEPITDIDSCDSQNPLAVVDYVEEIYAYYRKAESSSGVSLNYMAQQFDINEKMRAILIDWLIEVHYKFELMDETLFLTVNLIDRFLARQGVVRKKLQLVGVTAMLLACKYEEVTVPVVEDLILISDKAYTRKEVIEMEKLMVNALQFNMSVPTPYVFMRRFLKAAQSDNKLELLSFFMIELCLVEYEMLRFPPSLLAAAAIYTAQCTLKRSRQWTKTSEWHTNYTEDQLMECSNLMIAFHQKAGTGKNTGVYRKYSTFRFGYAAKSEPAISLLDTRL
ncbi:hypothetical protein NE237_023073 [Protea cynaroides]|uniref:B-like cyclin n=1 Tax=Protea cynaroides TaxID=273540 RepID=A0A9Q0HC83_9MAGN|nr:hypothetical protein NE237_023073 [Protea cynaroides]